MLVVSVGGREEDILLWLFEVCDGGRRNGDETGNETKVNSRVMMEV